MQDNLFNNSFGLKLSPDQIVREIINFMKADKRRNYKIIIGTDSGRAPDKTADFVTAIVVHRIGNGGRYFWRRIAENNKYHTLRHRMTQEVLLSLEVAKNILQKLKEKTSSSGAKSIPAWDFEIHVDVGENGDTKVMIQELVGMIRANNFEAKTKPYSYAASSVADRHV